MNDVEILVLDLFKREKVRPESVEGIKALDRLWKKRKKEIAKT